MAMKLPDQSTGTPGTLGGADVLEVAAAQLRDRVEPRWVEISDRILAKVLTATRRSFPVRAVVATGPTWVSEQVLVSYLRDAIHGHVAGSTLQAIHVHLVGRDTFESVTILIAVDYGEVIVTVADEIHRLVARRLDELLGPAAPEVEVRGTHVHVADVVPPDYPTGHDDEPQVVHRPTA